MQEPQYPHCSTMTLASVLVILILFSMRGARTQTVSQPEGQIAISERDSLELTCTASYTGSPRFYWYVQYPKQSLQMLLKYFSGNTLVRGSKGFEAEFNKNNKSFNLRKPSVEVSDAAVYFCAVYVLGSGTNELNFGKGTRVIIKPNIKDPQPALYQLTSPKSSDTSVCLLTDFDSSNTYTNGNDSTVLEMMTMESKSYGAVAWGSKSSFNCTNAFPQNIINLTQPSGSTCKVQDVEQSFETDKDLNLMNASLIFLRVIFLKTVGFNLLMTLRLWSN